MNSKQKRKWFRRNTLKINIPYPSEQHETRLLLNDPYAIKLNNLLNFIKHTFKYSLITELWNSTKNRKEIDIPSIKLTNNKTNNYLYFKIEHNIKIYKIFITSTDYIEIKELFK